MPSLEEIRQEIPPLFEVAEDFAPDLKNVDLNDKLRVILNYKVIEKTKSFVVLQITSIYMLPKNRIL